jgi:hypothetical protein
MINAKRWEQQELNLEPRSHQRTAAHERPEQTTNACIIMQRKINAKQIRVIQY